MQPPFLFRTLTLLSATPPRLFPPALCPPGPFPFPVLLSSRFPHPLLCRSLTPPLDPPPQRLEETSAQGFRQLLELNLLGTYTLTKVRLGSPPPGLADLLTMSLSDLFLSKSQMFSVPCFDLILEGLHSS